MPSPPNFSRKASASTIAIMASPTTPAAGTAQTSLRSTTASTVSLVARSTDLSGVRSVESGFIAARTTSGWPLVTPPSRPPALLVERLKPWPASNTISSCTPEPGVRAVSKPMPNSQPLMAWIEQKACASRPASRRAHPRGRLAGAGALEHVADVAVAVLHGAGEVGVPGAGPRHFLLRRARLGHRHAHGRLPVLPVAVGDAERDGRAERGAPADAGQDVDLIALDLHAAAAAVAALAPGEVAVDVGFGQRKAGRDAVDDGDQRLTVGFARGEEAEDSAHDLPLSGAGLETGARRVATDHARCHEDDQLAVRVRLRLLRLEQPADDRDVAEQRHLAHALDVGPLGDPADDEGVAFLDEDQRVRAPLVDAGDEAAGARVDVRALRVVLDHDQ